MDPSVSLLFSATIPANARTLLIADENTLQAIAQLPSGNDTQLLTNRYDVFLNAKARQLACHYSDFDFSAFEAQSFDFILYRVSKERAVAHHIINHTHDLLKPAGSLILSGAKNEGIKSYASNAAKLFGTKANTEKHGTLYRAILTKSAETPQALLDSKDYPTLRTISAPEHIELLSKPGVFGWNKIDRGSELLLTSAEQYFTADTTRKPETLLDLGCGYGYITISTKHWSWLRERWATDNNAAAIECMTANAKINDVEVEVIADDCATHIDKRFDLILCNPPFHQGFDTDQSLTLKFLEQSRRHLHSKGVALFVVNQFIAIPKLAGKWFSSSQELNADGSFKVYALMP